MSAAESKELRKETKKFIDKADERVLKMVYAMLDADVRTFEKDDFALTSEQYTELDECLAR